MKHMELKATVSQRSFLILYWILTAVFAALSVLVSDLFVPISAAFFSVLILFESSNKHLASISLGGLMLTVLTVLNPAFVLFALQIILTAVITVFCFTRGRSKAECVLLLTVTMTLFTFLVLLFAAFQKTGEYTLSSALEYYREQYALIKDMFVDSVSSMVGEAVGGGSEFLFTPELAEQLFNTFATVLIALIVIVGFVFAGIALKLTLRLAARVAKDPTPFSRWDFEVPSLYAYFYLVLVLLSFFLKAEGVFAITVLNLYYIFCAVFAYLGLKYSYRALVAVRKRRGSTAILLALSILLFSTLALQVLSFFGAYLTISKNKRIPTDTK